MTTCRSACSLPHKNKKSVPRHASKASRHGPSPEKGATIKPLIFRILLQSLRKSVILSTGRRLSGCMRECPRHFLMQGCRARNTQPASFSFIITESFENVNSIFIFCRFILNFLKWERPAGRLRHGKRACGTCFCGGFYRGARGMAVRPAGARDGRAADRCGRMKRIWRAVRMGNRRGVSAGRGMVGRWTGAAV